MKYIASTTPERPVGMPTLELTRRNLTALLAKLDGHPPNSRCTLIDPNYKIIVKAVEDAEHYSDRSPGPLHAETDEFLQEGKPLVVGE
jgi:hypothetical protein